MENQEQATSEGVSETAPHAACKAWLDSVVLGDAQFGVSPLALGALVRIVTNRKAFALPSPRAEAFAFCDNLFGQPNCEIVEPGRRHWPIFKRLCVEADIRGPGITDAWYAALAIEKGCTWISFDRDFARFPELDWRKPS